MDKKINYVFSQQSLITKAEKEIKKRQRQYNKVKGVEGVEYWVYKDRTVSAYKGEELLYLGSIIGNCLICKFCKPGFNLTHQEEKDILSFV